MSRRSFIKGFGILGAFAGGIGGIKSLEAKELPVDISQLSPEDNLTTIKLNSGNNSTTLSVGKDNRLWIKINDEWKRISIE
jgi:hypothetical protein